MCPRLASCSSGRQTRAAASAIRVGRRIVGLLWIARRWQAGGLRHIALRRRRITLRVALGWVALGCITLGWIARRRRAIPRGRRDIIDRRRVIHRRRVIGRCVVRPAPSRRAEPKAKRYPGTEAKRAAKPATEAEATTVEA